MATSTDSRPVETVGVRSIEVPAVDPSDNSVGDPLPADELPGQGAGAKTEQAPQSIIFGERPSPTQAVEVSRS